MNEIEHRVHWLSFTVKAESESAFTFYNLLLRNICGDAVPRGHGGRGFREIYEGSFGINLYLTPVNGGPYWHCEIPGQAWDVLGWLYFQAIGDFLVSNFGDLFAVTRLDYAFDYVPFTPEQAELAIRENQIRTLAKRETLEVHASPFAPKDNGEIGTYTVCLGSRTSERMIRIYNQRGFTRLEFETKNLRADLIARLLVSAITPEVGFYTVLAHLRDYIDFFTPWWEEFANSANRAGATVTNTKEVSMLKMTKWIDKQVAPSLSVVYDVLNPEMVDMIIKRGRIRRGAKYNHLLGKYDD